MSLRAVVTLTLFLAACSKGPAPLTTSPPPTSVSAATAPTTIPPATTPSAPADAAVAAAGDAAPAAEDVPAGTAPAAPDGSVAPDPAEVAPAEASAAAPAAAPCVAKEEATSLERLTLTGAVVGFCIPDPTPNGGELALACFDFDLATDTLTKKPSPAAPKPEPVDAPAATQFEGTHWKADLTANKLDACPTPDTCKALDLDGKVIHEGAVVSESADGKYLVTILDTKSESAPVAPWVYVYELATGKRVAKKKVGDESYTCGTASFVGNTVLVALDVCAGPGGIAWLAKPTNLAKIADLGPKDYGQFDPQFVPLGGDEFAFLEAGARSVIVQNVVTGKVVRRLDLSSNFPTPEGYEAPDIPPYGGTIDLIDLGAAAAVGNGRILVTLSDAGFGKLVVIDGAVEHVVKVHELPRCQAHP